MKQINNDYKIKCYFLNHSRIYRFICYSIFIMLFALNYYFINLGLYNKKNKSNIYFEEFETNIYNEIKNKLEESRCSLMWGKQREFINGIIRKYRPKKIVELGVFLGGSSIIILNAIKDIKNSHLYSIDINANNNTGRCVKEKFSYLLDKWTLFKGDISARYIEGIGKNIDLAMIDTSHFEPGEILDFALILPFLKEEAIVIFHDIDNQITYAFGKDMREEWAPYIIFNLIRGEKYFPQGKTILNKDIGAIKLEKNQKRYIHDYCRALAGQWQYFPPENHIKSAANIFKKYYDKECLNIFEESIKFNRKFIKDTVTVECFHNDHHL